VANPSEVNSALEYYCEVGDIQDDVLRPQLSLLASLISEPAFNVLRTKEQLGYIVFALPRASTGTMGMRFIIQSEKDTVYLETRVEAFFDHMKEFLDNLSEEEYEKHKAGVVHKKLEKPKNLHGESSRFWTAVEDGYYDFERRKLGRRPMLVVYRRVSDDDLTSPQIGFRDAEYTKSIPKQDIIDLFMSRIHYNSPIRKKLSIHMRSTYQGVKFDPARATPIIQAFTAKQVPVSQEDMGALLATLPGLPEIQKFARDCLAQATHLSEEDKVALDKQVADLDTAKAAPGEKEAKLREGNVVIDDIVQFKAGLRPSRAPVPVRKFSVV
jgi:insulysin